jgi:hypothetical protein
VTAGEYACGLPRSPVWLRRGGVQYWHVRDQTCERGPSVHGAPHADTEGWTGGGWSQYSWGELVIFGWILDSGLSLLPVAVVS